MASRLPKWRNSLGEGAILFNDPVVEEYLMRTRDLAYGSVFHAIRFDAVPGLGILSALAAFFLLSGGPQIQKNSVITTNHRVVYTRHIRPSWRGVNRLTFLSETRNCFIAPNTIAQYKPAARGILIT